MATRTPGLQTRSEYHSYWGSYATALLLPNAAGAPLPAPNFAKLEAGDIAYVSGGGGSLYFCTSPGTLSGGDAVWEQLDAATTPTSVVVSETSGSALVADTIVAIDDSAGSPRVFPADADGAGELPNAYGIVLTAAGAAGIAVLVLIAGKRAIPDANWSGGVPAVTDVGKRVFLSETAGLFTLTPPVTVGSSVFKVALVAVGGAGAVQVLWQPGEPVIL